jgi:hypothetical protein
MSLMEQAGTQHRRNHRAYLAVSALTFSALFTQFFWTTLRTRFRLLSGDNGDGSLIAFLHEHVYRAILGQVSLRDPPFFFPQKGVLGYTDAFLLNQIFYAPMRALGVEQFVAAQLTYMALSLMGGVAFAILLTRFLGVRVWLAIIAGGIFAFGHALFLKTLHPQHLAIHYLPVIACLVLEALGNEHTRAKTIALSFAAGLMFGLCFATGYYMSWLFCFFLLFAFPVFAFLQRTALTHFVAHHRARLVASSTAAAVGFGCGAAVLLWIYLPTISTLRELSAHQFLATAATFRDILNVSDGNLIWGALLRDWHIIPIQRLEQTELGLAVTPLLVLATLVGTVRMLRDREDLPYDRMAIALCVSVLFGYLMVYAFTISFRGTTSLFLLVQKVIPGAIAIRTGFRSQVISAMFVTLAFAVAAETYLRSSERAPTATIFGRWRSLGVLGLGVVLALEQVDIKSFTLLDRVRETAMVADAPPPPANCRVMAVYNDGSRWLPAIHIDAMRLSQRLGIPTVNGYSGGGPPGWNIGNVWEPDYIEKVRTWMRKQHEAGPLCLYDATVKSWRDLGSIS